MDMIAWIVSGALPAAVAAVGCWLASRLDAGKSHGRHINESKGSSIDFGNLSEGPKFSLSPLIVGLGWSFAITLSLMGQRITSGEDSCHLWPDDFWQRGYWCVLGSAILLGGTSHSRWAMDSFRWVTTGLLAFWVAFMSLPVGEGWSDMMDLHRGWMLLLGSTCLLSFWSLEQLARRESGRWFSLVILAILAGPVLFAATTYSSLLQWTISAVVATLVCVLFGLIGKLESGIGIAYPAAAFATITIAAGRFYSYEDHPWWSYLGMLSIGPLVVLIDRWIPLHRRVTRVVTAALVAGLMIAGSAIWHLSDLD